MEFQSESDAPLTEAESKCVYLKEAKAAKKEIFKKVQAFDVPGHFNFREKIQEYLNGQVKVDKSVVGIDGVIVVVDSNDK